jgi:putative membrane protein insertion efficiency factor
MLVRVLIALIELYQITLSRLLVGVLGSVCRFEPSCSRYAVACLRNHGVFRGGLLSLARLCKCHPFHPGGYDPPPGLPCPPAIEGAELALAGGQAWARVSGASKRETG